MGVQINLGEELIAEALAFYQIDPQYQAPALACLQELNHQPEVKARFAAVYQILYLEDTEAFRELWAVKEVADLFGEGANPFLTNLMILLGVRVHQAKLQAKHFDQSQIAAHQRRVKQCFINDLQARGYAGVRISQMLWASYFINCRLIEVGILQYEHHRPLNAVKIHIPRLPSLDWAQVKQSLSDCQDAIQKYFNLDQPQLICDSWLLSPQLTPLLPDTSRIRQFQTLFTIRSGDDCLSDILSFVYRVRECPDFNLLPETTALQRNIKRVLLQGVTFTLGHGVLRDDKNRATMLYG